VHSVRLIAVLSATNVVCRSGAGILERYVLDEIKNPRLAVYVVWEPVEGSDTEEAAAMSSRILKDPRAVQFLARDRFVGESFAPALGSSGTPAWDVFLLFPAGARWDGTVPVPLYLTSNRPDLEPSPSRPRLNGKTIAAKVEQALAAAGAAGRH
jgi:hypothetical protein